MEYTYYPEATIHFVCPNGHRTSAPIVRVEVIDGQIVGGIVGSAADFCLTCDAPMDDVVGEVELPERWVQV